MDEINDKILEDLYRYLNDYGWSLGMARKLINRSYGTNFTDRDLRLAYRARYGQIPSQAIPK